MKNTNIRKCAECAVMIALATVLSYLTIFKAPYGGSVTAFSQVPIVIIGYRHGFKWGALTGVVYGILQMLLQGLGNFAYVSGIGSYLILIFFDYILAFGVLGIAGAFFRGMFKSNRQLQPVALGISAVVASALRLLCHFISGVTIWGEYADGWKSVWVYSLAYNGFYMLFEGIITVVGVVALGLVLDFHSPNLTKKRA
ncbi:MAG: energy-coupled thiamine transporter ThiT [Ruminococcus sp.]|nr:energy-coupled thiamine transporter ThiT [Ruminococcus sp.]